MYFIINNENYVIAASEKFIQKIGARDICLISSLYRDGSIIIDENSKNIKVATKELEFDYEKSKLYSTFGELTQFKLYDKEDKILEIKEDDDISYLKKIKKGVIEKEDNEFDIPKIAALDDTKEEREKEVANDSIPEIINEIENIDILDDKSTKDLKESIQDESKDDKNVITQDDKDIKKDELLEEINLIEPKEELSLEDNIKEAEIPPIPLEKIREKQKRKEQNENKDNEIKEKIVKIEDLNPLEDETEEDKNKSLFSWKNKKSEIKEEDSETIDTLDMIDIKDNELKEVPIKSDTNIETDKELKETNKDNQLDELIHELETIETKDEELNDKIQIEPLKDESISTIPSKEDKTESKEDEIVLKTKPSTKKGDEQNIITKIIRVQVESLDLEDNAKRLNIDLDSYKMLLNSYINEFDRVNELLKIGDSKTIDMLIDAGQLLALDSIVLKLTKLKNATETQDIEQKSKEIELYINELKNKIDNKKVDNSFNEVNTVSNVEPIKEEKEERLSSPIELKNIEDSVEEAIEEKSKIEEETNIIVEEKDILESAKTLLDNVDKKDVILEIEETAMELNIPESLVLEFTKDFLNQAKEHLPILIDEYKNGNIKELQQTAHMLKGAANNLRLNSIADILFKIQKSNDIETNKSFIIKFASLIKGLEEALNRVESK